MSSKKLLYYISDNADPYKNLALEEYFIEAMPEGSALMFLWQSENAVVIGRNQIAEYECNMQLMQADGVSLVRRITGGGAVYHDLGNLNFSLVLNNSDFTHEVGARIIQNALNILLTGTGVSADFSGRNDIEISGFKISGSAFFTGKRNSLHHGTLLVASNKEKVAKYLTPSREKLEKHSVRSVAARVGNIADFCEVSEISTLIRQIIDSFSGYFGVRAEVLEPTAIADAEVLRLERRNISTEWINERKPSGRIGTGGRLSFGSLRFDYRLNPENLICGLCVSSDMLDTEIPRRLEECLAGIEFSRNEISAALASAGLDDCEREVLDLLFGKTEFDVVIIGGGPGGYTAALKAAHAGLKTALIEKADIGGTCLNRGCIPAKALLHSAAVYSSMVRGAPGVCAKGVDVDFKEIFANKDIIVKRLRDGVEALLKAAGANVYRGEGRLNADGTVLVGEETLEARHVIIATGARPFIPDITGVELPGVVTSDELLELDQKIGSIVIIGGGVIGMEFAEFYSSFPQIKVTVVEMAERVLPMFDREVSQNLQMIQKKRGVSFYTRTKLLEIKQSDGTLSCRVQNATGDETEISGEVVLMALGRKADVPEYAVGDNVHVIGDAAGGIQLAHYAAAQAEAVVDKILGKNSKIDFSAVPSCVYTCPEIAAVGVTAEQAKDRGIEARTGKFIMSANGRSLIGEAQRGFMKVVADAESGILLGATLMCENASDIIGEAALAIANKLKAEDVLKTIHAHPTYYEGIYEACENIFGQSTHSMSVKV